jgi:hypothetical protein
MPTKPTSKRATPRKSKPKVPATPPAAVDPTAATQRLSSGDAFDGAPDKRDAQGRFMEGNRYRWQKGESGNPAGTKGPKLSDLLQQAMAQPMPADKVQALQDLIAGGATIGQIMAWAATLRAAEGDLEALTIIGDRTEGEPEQTIKFEDIEATRRRRWAAAAPALGALDTDDESAADA